MANGVLISWGSGKETVFNHCQAFPARRELRHEKESLGVAAAGVS